MKFSMKNIGIGALSLGVMMLTGWIDDQKMDEKVKKEVSKALAEQPKKES